MPGKGGEKKMVEDRIGKGFGRYAESKLGTGKRIGKKVTEKVLRGIICILI